MAQSRTTQELPKATQSTGTDQLILNVALANNQFQLSNILVSDFLSKLPDEINVSVDTLQVRQSSAPDIPTSSNTSTATQGKIWYDSGYLYIAVADGTVKRAALSTF